MVAIVWFIGQTRTMGNYAVPHVAVALAAVAAMQVIGLNVWHVLGIQVAPTCGDSPSAGRTS